MPEILQDQPGIDLERSTKSFCLSLWRRILGYERRRKFRKAVWGEGNPNWSRIVMMRETRQLVADLQPAQLDALEISGDLWANLGFRSYLSTSYPEYDVCQDTLKQEYDLILADQVFEHLCWPYRAGKNVYSMLRPGGHFLISTPFLMRIHNCPIDCSRWSETGLRYFLAECGFPLETVQTGSWGNRACVKANFARFVAYRPWFCSLENDPEFPVVVWALARKP